MSTLCYFRAARPSDAWGIYTLKCRVFGDRYLGYTIYQSPQSVNYLAELIARGSEQSHHSFFVISQAGEIRGYYHAVHRGTDFFLNYIAVTAVARRQGWGNALLEHYEDRGRASNCQRLMLDVFDSNRRVRDWYGNHGYQPHSASLCARLALDAWPESSFLLNYSDDDWARTRREEQVQGFSKIKCFCGPGQLTVGLIASRVCKLLDYEGIKLEDAVLAIVHRFRTEREILVVSSLSDIPSDWPVINVDKILRLIKPI